MIGLFVVWLMGITWVVEKLTLVQFWWGALVVVVRVEASPEDKVARPRCLPEWVVVAARVVGS